MDFGKRLASLRKKRSFTQAVLAERVGCHVTMIRRYESDETQPTLDVIRKLAIALSVSADTLVFGEDERGPDEDLRLQFEALSAMSPEEKLVAKAVLEAIIVKNQVTGAIAGALARSSTPPAAKEKAGR